MFCTQCANESESNVPFCQHCGGPIAALPTEPQSFAELPARSAKQYLLFGLPLLAILLIIATLVWQEAESRESAAAAYDLGISALENGDYEGASLAFARAGTYRDASQQLQTIMQSTAPWESAYLDGLAALQAERYEEAMVVFERLVVEVPDFRESESLLLTARDGLKSQLLSAAEEAILSRDWLTADETLTALLLLDPTDQATAERLTELRRRHAPIVFTRNGELYLIGPDLDDERLIADTVFAAAPVWSPDRSRIAFLSPDDPVTKIGSIYVINPDGSALQQVTDHALMEPVPLWSPDGQTIAFIEPAAQTGDPVTIVVRDFTRSTEVRLSSTGTGVTSLTWSPEGDQIAYISETLVISESLGVIGRAGDVEIADIRTLEVTKVTSGEMPGASAVVWSSDGHHLAVWESVTGTGWYAQYQSSIHLYDFKTRLFTTLTRSTDLVGPPSWSPSGDRIAWVQGDSLVQVRWIPGQRRAGIGVSAPISDHLIWSPDGLAILAIAAESTGTSALIPLPDGPGTPIMLPLLFDTNWPSSGPQWAPLTQPGAEYITTHPDLE